MTIPVRLASSPLVYRISPRARNAAAWNTAAARTGSVKPPSQYTCMSRASISSSPICSRLKALIWIDIITARFSTLGAPIVHASFATHADIKGQSAKPRRRAPRRSKRGAGQVFPVDGVRDLVSLRGPSLWAYAVRPPRLHAKSDELVYLSHRIARPSLRE